MPPRAPQPALLLRCPFSLRPPFSGFVDSVLVQTALSIWPYAFSPFVQRPETILGRVVGGLYTGNVAALLHLCFLKTHVNFRGRTGKSGLAGRNPYFPGDALIYVGFGFQAQSHLGSFLQLGEGLPYTEPTCGHGDWRWYSQISCARPCFGDEHSGF